MAIVTFSRKGEFKKTEEYLVHLHGTADRIDLDAYGQKGVEALKTATPKDTGKTSESWIYKITKKPNYSTIHWSNTNTNKGTNIAVIIQYGHGFKNGGFVRGIDYINPAIRPIFKDFSNDAKKEVTKS